MKNIPSFGLSSKREIINPKSLPKKNGYVQTEVRQSNAVQSLRLTLCLGVHLV
jgi:hypothetical protein